MAEDLIGRGAGELAGMIRRGEASAREVVGAHVQRLEEVQGALGAIAVARDEEALREADEADARRARGEALGPLHGVPITVKESFHLAGTEATAGVTAFRGEVAREDGAPVARLRAAGAIVLGKTNVAQLLWYIECGNPIYGRCNNPWDGARTPGGSSGGEAAAIAVGGSALGLGSDIGGSVRVPAHFCGVHALKPTSGRLDAVGSVEHRILPGMEAVSSQAGPLARRVADLALALRVLGVEERAPARDVHRLRVGLWTDNGHFAAAPALRRAVVEAAGALRDRGAEVEPFEPPEVPHAFSVYTRLMTADGGAALRRALAGGPQEPQIRDLLLGMGLPGFLRRPAAFVARLLGQRQLARGIRWAGAVSADEYFRLVAARDTYRARLLGALAERRIDALVCPPLGTVAVRHGTSIHLSQQQSHVCLFNLTGMPAGVVGATRVRAGEETDGAAGADVVERLARATGAGSAGMPVGVQVAAAPGREDVVRAVMGALEEHFRAQEGYPDRAEPAVQRGS